MLLSMFIAIAIGVVHVVCALDVLLVDVVADDAFRFMLSSSYTVLSVPVHNVLMVIE